jgi:hypothetical protein
MSAEEHVDFSDMAFGLDFDGVDYEEFVAPPQPCMTTKALKAMLPDDYLRDLQKRASVEMHISDSHHIRVLLDMFRMRDHSLDLYDGAMDGKGKFLNVYSVPPAHDRVLFNQSCSSLIGQCWQRTG